MDTAMGRHISPANHLSTYATTHAKRGRTKAADGIPLTIADVTGHTTVNGVPVAKPDVKADNGVMHLIDAVLLPPTPIAPNTSRWSGFTQGETAPAFVSCGYSPLLDARARTVRVKPL